MLGAGLQFGRSRGEDRFYNPAKARRNYQNRKSQDNLRRAQSDAIVHSKSPSMKDSHAVSPLKMEQESGGASEETPKAVVTPASEPLVSPLCNLQRFLESVTPSVPAQYLSKTTMRGLRTCDVEFQPYFVLGDLWESFKEWSAYGAGVPLFLNDSDCVVQYYVPYLSAIQIYGDPSKSSVKSRRPGEDSDGDYFRDSCSDASSDSEHERCLNYLREQKSHHRLRSEIPFRMDRLSLKDQRNTLQECFSSDEGESGNADGCLMFEHLERDQPHGRVPLADKISNLALLFPELKTLRSCDVLSSSWISVAWYPIYRIPIGSTFKDVDACFLTFHSLHTPLSANQSAQAPVVTYSREMDGVPRISLPVFGLSSYKFKASLWLPNKEHDQQLLNSLLQAADEWLTLLQVDHPDFLFFRCRWK
ncbi:Activating transcription factor 7-interacting protein like [Actinidia chinensis var. chinensis]|uniref:Activating transcription factor 7-interacting protein like n=1 Tax=Actinidia chinensis var. chinensis TaxID=1590841 RepID=A0A2R6QQQ3_ACTCC|nr:Activating transcription factor 7-interacting protein like [Actinidia chinensis var. chinensis]